MEYLIVKYEDFKKEINNYYSELQNLKNKEIQNEQDLNNFKEILHKVDSDIITYFKSAFNIEANSYVYEYSHINSNSFHITGIKLQIRQLIDNFRHDIQNKSYFLKSNVNFLIALDCVINQDEILLNQRKQYKTEEKLLLILEKLYLLYDNDYYPIKDVLEGNGIEIKRHGDEQELIKLLENRGLVDVQYLKNVSARLTPEGSIFIEENQKAYKENYSDIPNSSQELNDKINQIIEKLTLLGYGQEIIFDELEELKVLYLKLNKKTWGQVLKGKLMDLALAKLVEIDTIKFIFESLTDNKLKFIHQ